MSSLSSANTSTELSIIDFENGYLTESETNEFFQELIDTGQAWKLNGFYGRQAMAMIRSGQCMLGPVGHKDAYGNYVPAREEVVAGSPGSAEFVLNHLDG